MFLQFFNKQRKENFCELFNLSTPPTLPTHPQVIPLGTANETHGGGGRVFKVKQRNTVGKIQ